MSEQITVVKLSDALTYLECPLKLKYKKWGVKEKTVDVKKAIVHASSMAIAAYLKEASKPGSSRIKARRAAVGLYKSTLIQYDNSGLFDGDVYFAQHFNSGLVLIKRIDEELINFDHDAVVHGPHKFSFPIDNDTHFTGTILGLIALNDSSNSERRYAAVCVSPHEKIRSNYSRFKEGFYYAAMRYALEGLRQYPLSLIIIDPFTKQIQEVSISIEDKKRFISIGKAVLAGIKADYYLPQPSISACTSCSYRRSCDVVYCDPEEKAWHKRKFLERVK